MSRSKLSWKCLRCNSIYDFLSGKYAGFKFFGDIRSQYCLTGGVMPLSMIWPSAVFFYCNNSKSSENGLFFVCNFIGRGFVRLLGRTSCSPNYAIAVICICQSTVVGKATSALWIHDFHCLNNSFFRFWNVRQSTVLCIGVIRSKKKTKTDIKITIVWLNHVFMFRVMSLMSAKNGPK